MADLLTLKSEVKLGCDMCDTCCKYRGDIRLTIKNIFDISRFLKITPSEFIEKYTHEIEGQAPERALNAKGEFRECILYDTTNKKCSINPVKPLQCVMFPLFPEDIINDYFYMLDQCKCKNKTNITVNEWLNGNNNIYKKNKKINFLWVKVMEEIEVYWNEFSEEEKLKIKKLLYADYDFSKKNIDNQIKSNIKRIFIFITNWIKQNK